jgi:hypothetical protein
LDVWGLAVVLEQEVFPCFEWGFPRPCGFPQWNGSALNKPLGAKAERESKLLYRLQGNGGSVPPELEMYQISDSAFQGVSRTVQAGSWLPLHMASSSPAHKEIQFHCD